MWFWRAFVRKVENRCDDTMTYGGPKKLDIKLYFAVLSRIIALYQEHGNHTRHHLMVPDNLLSDGCWQTKLDCCYAEQDLFPVFKETNEHVYHGL